MTGILKDDTSETIDIFVQDSSVSTGAGLTGLVFNTAGLTCYYRRGATGTPTAITLATQTVGGAWSSGGFVAVDGSNAPGHYRFDIPNAVIATGVDRVYLHFKGAANMVPVVKEIELFDVLNVSSGVVQSNAVQIAGQSTSAAGSVAFPGTVASTTNITAGTITTVTNLTNLPAITTDWLTGTGVAASAVTKVQAGLATPTNITAGIITTVSGNVSGEVTSLSTAATAAVADKILGRNVAGGSDGGRTVAQSLYVLRNRVVIDVNNNLLTVYGVDDTTPAFSASITTAVRNALTSVDPT